METSFYFLNVYVDFAAEKTDIYQQVCDQSCFAAGNLCWLTTCWDSFPQRGTIYKMYCKAQLCFVERICL